MGNCACNYKRSTMNQSQNDLIDSSKDHPPSKPMIIDINSNSPSVSKPKSLIEKLKQLKSELEKQPYLHSENSNQSNQANIESRVQQIQKQLKNSSIQLDEEELGSKFMCEFAYQLIKLYHFISKQEIALYRISQLLSRHEELQKAQISILNLKIFKYLLEVIKSLRANYIRNSNVNQLRGYYGQLLGQIKADLKLEQKERQQMFIFVSCLHYHYALAKLNCNPQQHCNNSKVQIQIQRSSLQADLRYLDRFLLKFSLQLNLSSKDHIVNRVQLVTLNRQPSYKQKQQQNQKESAKENQKDAQAKFSQPESKVQTKLITLGNMSKDQKQKSLYLILAAIIDSTLLAGQQKRVNRFFFLNFNEIYIAKTNSASFSNFSSKWIKAYQHFNFYPKSDLQIQAASQAISLNEQAKLPQIRPRLDLNKQIDQLLTKRFNKQQVKPQLQAVNDSIVVNSSLTQSLDNTNRRQNNYPDLDNNSSFSKTFGNYPGSIVSKSPTIVKKDLTIQINQSDQLGQPNSNKHDLPQPVINQMQNLNLGQRQISSKIDQLQKQKQSLIFADIVNGQEDTKKHKECIEHIKNMKSSIQNQEEQKIKNEHVRKTNRMSKSQINPQKKSILQLQFPKGPLETRALDISKPFQLYFDRGLKNIGNTCYMNSALQCLHKSRHFTTQLINQSPKVRNKFRKTRRFQLTELFQVFINQMWKRQQAFNPLHIKHVMGQKNYLFKHNNQSDATQFFLTFLSIISEELNDPTKQSQKEISHYFESDRTIYEKIKFNDETYCRSIVESTFTGRYKVEYNSTLESCKHKYVLFEKFNVHYLDIPPVNRSSVKLHECLQYSKRPDELRPQDRMTCDTCHKSTFDIKNMEIYEVSQVLVLSFRRFLNGRKNGIKIKVPQFLSVSDVILKSELKKYKLKNFRLYSAIIHQGNLKGGHYYAICYNYHNNKWIKYNDSYASETSQNFNQIDFGNVMTLFYGLNVSQAEENLNDSQQLDDSQDQGDNTDEIQQKKQVSMIYSVINWLIKSTPFKNQFYQRLKILNKYQIPLSPNIIEFKKIIQDESMSQAYLKELLTRKQDFEFEYVANRSELQNYIITFIKMLSQIFLNCLAQGMPKVSLSFSEKEQLMQKNPKDMRQNLFLTVLNQHLQLSCSHNKITKPIHQTFQTIKFTGKEQGNFQITKYLKDYNHQRYHSDKKIYCKICGWQRKCSIRYQLLKTNHIFIIELQRFQHAEEIRCSVNVPLQISTKYIFEYSEGMYNNKIYRLSAVISYLGSINDGQYFVQCYDFYSQSWVQYKRQKVLALPSTPKFANACCLIYQLVQRRSYA